MRWVIMVKKEELKAINMKKRIKPELVFTWKDNNKLKHEPITTLNKPLWRKQEQETD